MKNKKKTLIVLGALMLLVLGVYSERILLPLQGAADALDALKPDKVLVNGKIVTVDGDFSIVEAVAIKDGRFLAVGNNADIRQLVGPTTEVIDLKGRTVLPGFIDPHVHFAHKVGKKSDQYEDMFANARSLEAVRKALQLKVQETPPGELVWFSRGVSRASDLAEKRWPTRWDLDPVSPDNPVILGFAADHVTVVNSKLIEMVGTITKDTPQPHESGFAGEIVKDPETGEPTGILIEKGATTLARVPFNLYPTETLEENILRGSREVVKYGLTSIYDPCTNISKAMDNQPGLQAYQRLSRQGKLTVRINAMIRMPIRVQTLEQNLDFLENMLFAPEFRNDHLRVGTLKISVDGSGMRVPPDKVKTILKAAHKAGWQMFIHLGGGESFDVVTESLDEAYREFPRENARHVITHARYPSQKNIEILKKYGVIVEPQTGSLFRASDDAESQVEEGRYGPIPTRTYLDNGIHVMTGTDQKPIGPLFTIWASVNRLRRSGKVIQPEERMTLQEAIRAVTIEPAYASFEEKVKGSIEVGKLADLVVLGTDLLTVPVEEIRNIPVLKTMIGGDFVYENQDEDPKQKIEYPFFG